MSVKRGAWSVFAEDSQMQILSQFLQSDVVNLLESMKHGAIHKLSCGLGQRSLEES